MLDIAEYKMMNGEGWLELYQTNTRSSTIKTVVIYLFIDWSSCKDKKQVLTPMVRDKEAKVSSAVISIRYILFIVWCALVENSNKGKQAWKSHLVEGFKMPYC